MHVNEVVEAERAIQSLVHNGENHPHICWAKCERMLNNDHAAMRKKHTDTTFPEEMKVRSLLGKTKDPQLKCLTPMITQQVKD